MKKLLTALSCVLALTTGSAQAQSKDWSTVRIAFDVPYEPFEYRTPDGELTGFEVDLARAVCEEIKAKCEMVVQAWDGMIPALLARKYDAIMSSMSITEERKEKVLFSEPYYNTPGAWFVKDTSELDVNDKDAMKGKNVGVQRGTTMDSYVTENYAGVVNVKRYTTADDLALDIGGGRLDAVFVDYPVGEEALIKKGGFKQVGEGIKLGDGVGVAFRKRDTDLAEKFNAALRKLKDDGTYDTIMKKYFSYDIKM